jgi:hypothetical protein
MIWKLPFLALFVSVIAAFVGAEVFHGTDWLSRIPPAGPDTPSPVADVPQAAVKTLYRSAYTAWAALVLMIPAFVYVWRRNSGAWAPWQAWWTVSYIAFAIHMFWAMAIFFGGDFDAMQTSTRVSAFWPGIALLIWWGIDVVLSFLVRETALIRIQRIIVHLLAFVLMVGGSLVKGETLPIKALGLVLLLATLASGIAAYRARRRVA